MGEIKSLDNYTFVDETARAETAKLQARPSNNHAYEGRDLSTIFTAEELHNAVASGDFSNIFVGDYWPITLSGTIYDYADSINRTLDNEVIYLEVAGVNFYHNYCVDNVPNHLLFCSRNLLPWTLKFRSGNTAWYDENVKSPWVGSHLYQTLNNEENGLICLVKTTEIGAYIYEGNYGSGMTVITESKKKGNATAVGWAFASRGKLFLPYEREIWGADTWSEHEYGAGCANQWTIFSGTMKHIIKRIGNDGSLSDWWCGSSVAQTENTICACGSYGMPSVANPTSVSTGSPVCFLFA